MLEEALKESVIQNDGFPGNADLQIGGAKNGTGGNDSPKPARNVWEALQRFSVAAREKALNARI
jgi:hypothetical protein